MRLRHIEVFHAVYTSGSITNAAKLLYVSQPSVSKVLSHAELQLGFLLFERVKGRLIPTNEAILLFEEVDRVYQQMHTIKNAADNIKNNQIGRVGIAVTPALGFDIIPSAISEYRKQHGHVSFDVQTLHNDQVKDHLLRHTSEIAVVFEPSSISGIANIELDRGNMVAVYRKEMFPDCPKILKLEDLLKYPLIDIAGSGPLADLVWSAINAKKIKPISKIKVQTYFIAVNLVKKGMGVCLVDEFTAKSQLNDEIAMSHLTEKYSFSIKALYLKNKPLSRTAKDFLEFFRSNL